MELLSYIVSWLVSLFSPAPSSSQHGSLTFCLAQVSGIVSRVKRKTREEAVQNGLFVYGSNTFTPQ